MKQLKDKFKLKAKVEGYGFAVTMWQAIPDKKVIATPLLNNKVASSSFTPDK